MSVTPSKIGVISAMLMSGAVLFLGACSSSAELAYSGSSVRHPSESEQDHERSSAEAAPGSVANEACRTDVSRRNEYGQVTEHACEDEDREAWRGAYQDDQPDEPDVSFDESRQEVEPE
jgi:hypothetical protein